MGKVKQLLDLDTSCTDGPIYVDPLTKFPLETYEEEVKPTLSKEGRPMTREEYLQFARRTTDSLLELIAKKNADYTSGSGVNDFAANFRESEKIGISALKGLHLRMGDKWQRLNSFHAKGNLQGESVKDALLDMVGYSLLALALLDERSKARWGLGEQSEAKSLLDEQSET